MLNKIGEISAIIDEGCHFEGNLSFDGVARISGNVNGSIYSNDTIIIGEIITAPINKNIKDPIKRINKHFNSIVKGGTDLNPSEVLSGWRPIPKDDLPIIGKFKNKSVYIAVMHSGISLAAIVGNLVTQEIVSGVDNLLLTDFRPSRFF